MRIKRKGHHPPIRKEKKRITPTKCLPRKKSPHFMGGMRHPHAALNPSHSHSVFLIPFFWLLAQPLRLFLATRQKPMSPILDP
jgi:hypothetical protein